MTSRLEIYNEKVKRAKKTIQEVYLDNDYVWMIGYSGGKDSSVLVQLVIEAIGELPHLNLKNKIHIVSSDTLIENPIVLKQLNSSLELLKNYVEDKNLPFIVHKVKPDIEESFWVNLIGRGYPLPNQSFRWCTDRLKIKPMNYYVNKLENEKPDNILTVLGVRKGESNSRDIKMNNHETDTKFIRENTTNPGFIFSPIEEFNLYDIWKFLADSRIKDFHTNNQKLSILYEDSAYGVEECPSSLDDKLQKGCGNSRWGCWLCPVVTQDKSLEGFVNSGNVWLQPLLDFRKKLMDGRDKITNRYHGSLRINKQNKRIKLIKYRYINLRLKNGVYSLPEKSGRVKKDFGELSSDGKYLGGVRILSESEYRNKIDEGVINPYLEKDSEYMYSHIIRLDKNKEEGILSIPGLGPYTVSYRKKLLSEIVELNNKMKNEDITIITDREIEIIEELIRNVKNSIKSQKIQTEQKKKIVKDTISKKVSNKGVTSNETRA